MELKDYDWKHALGQLVEALRYKPQGRGFDSRWCQWNFSLTLSFWSHCGCGVDSASNRNEYQEYFLGGKGGRCLGLITLPLHVPIVLISGSLTCWNPQGLSRSVMGLLYLYFMMSMLFYVFVIF